MKKPKVDIDKKKYFIANGEPFSKFVKRVEASKNNQSAQIYKEITEEYIQGTVKKIVKEVDRHNAWDKLR